LFSQHVDATLDEKEPLPPLVPISGAASLEGSMKASALKNMPVVSIADGAKVGNVTDVLFDTASLRVAALVLSAETGQSVLPFGSIKSVGSDAVTVESSEATRGAAGQSTLNSMRGLSDLTKLPVVNGEGVHLGGVKELEIDQADGRLLEIVAHRGGVLGLGGTSTTVAASAIQSIGPNLVTVDMPAPSEEASVP
jgi:sporulation protein YlmC with PRC-barrel domain